MEELIINCQTGEITRRPFTKAEIKQRLAEIGKAKEAQREQGLQEAKDILIAAQRDLQVAQTLTNELDPADIEAKTAILTQARQRLKDLQGE